MSRQLLEESLNKREDLRRFLFIRGFMLTNNQEVSGSGFPFYNEWNQIVLHGYSFWTHKLTGFHYIEVDNTLFFLLGHSYNPFTMEIDESLQLKRIAEHFGETDFYSYVNELTGIFVLGYIFKGNVSYLVDPSGMQSACSGVIHNKFYLSSHPQLIADLCGLNIDRFVERLISYKWYGRVMGPYLPADLTAFQELKRVVPNMEYTYANSCVTHKRFYPLADLKEVNSEDEYREVIQSAAVILKNGMELVSKKWVQPWISLTGGIDSNTTFAAASGHYDSFHTFSYHSAEKESIDCEAAEKISKRFGVPWTLFEIPTDSTQLPEYELKAEIIQHNNAYIAKAYDNELRKRIYLEENLPCDVEVKSWVSETIRAYWYKHYGRKAFPKLSGKLFRNLYKIFLSDRELAHEIDAIFDKYIEEYDYNKIPCQYPPADMHFNEVTWGSWGGLNISEMKFYSDITIVYNNRVFLDLLFRVPLEKRISDQHHLDMKRFLNPELYDMGIRVVNLHETAFRAFCLNLIFTANTILPF